MWPVRDAGILPQGDVGEDKREVFVTILSRRQ